MKLAEEATTFGITGVGGFIGFRMVERALARGLKVKGMDVSEAAVKAVTKRLKDHPKAHNLLVVFVGSVTDPVAAARLCQDCDVIFHTAAILDIMSSFETSRKVNVQGTVVVAQAAKEHHVKRFVHLSSVMVYGFTFPKYVKEDGPKRGENDPYCQTKIESEAAVMKFHEPGKMEVIVIRPGDVYGAHSPQWVIGALVLMKRDLMILPNGGQGCMNHVHVDNLLDGVFLTLENDKATGEAFNITDGGKTTWIEYYTRLAKLAGLQPPRTLPSILTYPAASFLRMLSYTSGTKAMNPKALGFISRPHPYSIEKAKKVLGYVPKITLDEGFEEIKRALAKQAAAKQAAEKARL